MDLLTIAHIVTSWWFPLAMFLLPIGLYILFAFIKALIEDADVLFSGGGGGYSTRASIKPPSGWSTSEKMKQTYYAEKLRECLMKGEC